MCLHHHGVRFFNISTSKSRLRRFLHFWFRHVLRATTACIFSSSQLPKVLREWSALYVLTSTCASRHNGVQVFISHLARWLRTRRFSEPTRSHKSLEKTQSIATFPFFPIFRKPASSFLWHFLFSSLIFFLLLFSSLLWLFPPLLFHLPILPEVWLLNLLR